MITRTFDLMKLIGGVIVIVGWVTGNLSWWIAVPLILAMCELKWTWGR